MDVGGAVSGFTSAIETVVGMSRSSRLRRAIEVNVKLYASMIQHDDLATAAKHMSALIERQAAHLSAHGDGSVRKERSPGGLFVGLMCTAVVGLGGWWLIVHRGHWWFWPLIVLDVLVVLLFFGSSISAYFSPSNKKKASSPNAEIPQVEAPVS